MKCITCIVEFFKKILLSFDYYFSIPIDIKYKNRRRFSNKTTVFCSLITYLIIISASISFLSSLFSHFSPNLVLTNQIISDKYLNITISNENSTDLIQNDTSHDDMRKGMYIFGYALYNKSNNSYVEQDPKYLIIREILTNITNGKKYRTFLNVTDNNENFFNKKNIDNNISFLFSNSYIKILNNSFDLFGEYIDKTYTYLSIKVIRCNPLLGTIYSEFKNITCSNETQWIQYINNIQLKFLYIDMIRNPKNYGSPITPYVSTDSYDFITTLCQKDELLMSYILFNSYNNYIPSFQSGQNVPFSYNYITINQRVKYYVGFQLSDSEILNIIFHSDNQTLQIDRYYQNIFYIMAILIGIWKALIAIINFILFKYNDFSENLEMCNTIFKLVDIDKKKDVEKNHITLIHLKKKENVEINLSLTKNNYSNSIIENPKESKKTPKNIKIIDLKKHTNLEEVVLYEGFKFDKFSGLEFNWIEILMHMSCFKLNTKKTEIKLQILRKATEHYNNFKDTKNLFMFAISLKELLKFYFTKDQTFIISNLLNKTKFHNKNIENFNIIRNIVSFSSMNDEEDKKLERREILKNTLNKFRNRKRGELNPIDEKLLTHLKIDENLLNYFIYNELEKETDSPKN